MDTNAASAPKKLKQKKRNEYLICRQPLKVAQLYLNKLKLLLCGVALETFASLDLTLT